MKTQLIVPAMLGVLICLTGCGRRSDLNVQKDTIPVVPVETEVTVLTAHSSETETLPSKGTNAAAAQTTIGNPVTVPVTSISAAAAETAKAGQAETATRPAETAAQQNQSGGSSGSSGGASGQEQLYGKWETVSFSKETGGRISYDLSDPVHRSYYVGLELNDIGQSSLTVGTEGYPASAFLRGNTLSVMTISRDHPVSMDFTVSADRKSMTVALVGGRIIATLKRVSSDFSIRQYQSDEPEADLSMLAGDWNYQEEDPQVEGIYNTVGFLTVESDGRYVYQPADGSLRRRGTVQVAHQELSGSSVPFFAFKEDEGDTPWISTDSCAPSGRGTFSVGGSAARLNPWNPQANKFDYYVGQWQSDKCTIRIGRDDESYLVKCTWSETASEYNEWVYHCEGSRSGTELVCTGGGTCTHVVTAEDGSEARTEVYRDGTAQFSMNGSKLTWTAEKEQIAQQFSFTLIG